MERWKVLAILAISATISAIIASLAAVSSAWWRFLFTVIAPLVGMGTGYLMWKRWSETESHDVLVDERAGVYSWSYFERVFKLQVACSRRYEQPTSILVVQMRQRSEEDSMDTAAIQVAKHLQWMCRNTDIITRSEEGQVVALLTWTPAGGALELADRVLASLRTMGFGYGQVGIGLASYESGLSPEALLDKAMSCAQYSLDLDGLRVIGPGMEPVHAVPSV